MNTNKIVPPPELVAEFRRLETRHNSNLVVERTAFVALGPSLIRAFKKGTKSDVIPALLKIDLNRFAKCKLREEFRLFFEDELKKVYHALALKPENIEKHGNGLKWGHATKILCIYLRDLVLYSRYFDEETAKRLESLLYNPIDRVVMDRLRDLGVDPRASSIKDIDTADKFWRLQGILDEAAKLTNTNQIRFDDVQAEDLVEDS